MQRTTPANGRIRVGLIFGGRSAEHEISIRSARSIVAAIDRTRFDVTLIGIDRTGTWHLHTEQSLAGLTEDAGQDGAAEVIPAPHSGALGLLDVRHPERPTPALDVVFPVVHGTFGEDGTLQGLLEMIGLPYVGAGVLGSAIGMDKDVQKRLLHAAALPVVPWTVTTQHEWDRHAGTVSQRALNLRLPLFVKPANMGSSIGISKVSDAAALPAAVATALAYDTKIVIEQGVDAREIECSVLGNEDPCASVPGEIVPGETFYSYEDKYRGDSKAALVVPARLSTEIAETVRSLAVRTFQVLELAGMARVDFFLDRQTNQLSINEVNTLPGFTAISMYPKLWEASGLSYPALITRLVELALDRHAIRTRLRNRPASTV